MSDTSTTDEEQNGNEEGGITQLRDAARKGKAALDENAELKRQLLFAKASIDTDSKLGKMLFQTWQGGDDIDALKAEALEIGIGAGAPAKTPAEIAAETARADEDTRRTAAQQNLGGGTVGAPPGQEGPNPMHNALEQFHRDAASGIDENEARTGALARVIAAGLQGDTRILFDAAAHQARGIEADKAAGASR